MDFKKLIMILPAILAFVSLFTFNIKKFRNYSALKTVLITAVVSIILYTIFLTIIYLLITNNYIK